MRKITRLKQGQKLPPNGDNVQGFLRTPWNATSRTPLKMHILNRNTSIANHSWPLALVKSWTKSPET